VTNVIPIHGERAHSELGASAAHRWLACPGSVQAQRGRPERPAGAASVNGTICHEASEFALRGNWSADEIPDHMFAGLVDVEPAEARRWVAYYLDLVRAMPGHRLVEARVDFSRWVPTGFGTADCVVVSMEQRHVAVVDAKFGQVRVAAEDNPQLRLYALGVRAWLADTLELTEADFAGFQWECAIVQPRLDWIATEVVTDEALMAFAERAGKAARLALSDDAPRVPSEDACQWCAARGDCKARADATLAEVITAFGPAAVDDLDDDVDALVPPSDMAPEELARVLRAAPALTKWIADVRDHAQSVLLAGDAVPGFKVVASRANRAWHDTQQASAALEATGIDNARLWKRSFISPAEAEKLGREAKSLVASLTYKPDGTPQVVTEGDPRPPLASAQAIDAFSSSTR
jgi:hypothetical protein